jgi:hypothetical protein
MQGQKRLHDGLKGVKDLLFLEGQGSVGSSASLEFVLQAGFHFGQEEALSVPDWPHECGGRMLCFWEGRACAFVVVVDGPGGPVEEEDLCGLEGEDGEIGVGGHRKNYLLIISSINSYSPNAFGEGTAREGGNNVSGYGLLYMGRGRKEYWELDPPICPLFIGWSVVCMECYGRFCSCSEY